MDNIMDGGILVIKYDHENEVYCKFIGGGERTYYNNHLICTSYS